MRASAVIVQKGKVLLMHRRKNGQEYWVFPGGGVEDGESKVDAIKREVLEETNLNATDCQYSFDFKDESGNYHPVFLCMVESGQPKLSDDSPEAKKNSPDNWYHPEWVTIKRATSLNVYPPLGKRMLKKFLK